jgi:hypothetical protein
MRAGSAAHREGQRSGGAAAMRSGSGGRGTASSAARATPGRGGPAHEMDYAVSDAGDDGSKEEKEAGEAALIKEEELVRRWHGQEVSASLSWCRGGGFKERARTRRLGADRCSAWRGHRHGHPTGEGRQSRRHWLGMGVASPIKKHLPWRSLSGCVLSA